MFQGMEMRQVRPVPMGCLEADVEGLQPATIPLLEQQQIKTWVTCRFHGYLPPLQALHKCTARACRW